MELLIDGIDITGFELVYATLSEAEPKTYIVDVPGGGSIDLTEFAGDVAYKDRTLDALLIARGSSHAAITSEVASLANVVDGERLRFRLSERPGLTWTGRFSMGATDEDCAVLKAFHLSATVSPFGSRGAITFRANCATGVWLSLGCGRRSQCPAIEVSRRSLVVMGDVSMVVEPGSWRLRDLWLKSGTNRVFIDTYLGDGNRPISSFADQTISSLSDVTVSRLLWVDSPLSVRHISDIAETSISDIAATAVAELEYGAETGSDEQYAAYISYEIEEL